MNFFQSRKSLVLSLVFIILALFLIFIMAGNNKIKNFLNEKMSDSVTIKPFSELRNFLPDYFNYLNNSAFWIETGDFGDLRDSSASPDLLRQGVLGTLAGVSALNYVAGQEMTTFLLSEDEVVTSISTRDLSSSERYIRLENNSLIQNMYLTDFHLLTSTGEMGFSVVMEIRQSPFVSISLDISLARLAEHYQQAFNENAILFLAINSNEFITLPLDKNFLKNREDDLFLKNNKEYTLWQELVQKAQDESVKSVEEKPYLISYDGRQWFVIPYMLNGYGGEIGFIIPESTLFFSQFNTVYIIIAIPFILLFLSMFSLFFIYRYREKHSLTEEELLLRLISEGESSALEFKSSLRWDLRENSLNKKLEEVIMKSIAAFANGQGGTLLIGVDDEGAILGLANDYSTLKQKNKDAFELHLRNLVSSMYGTFTIDKMDVKFIDVMGEQICQIIISPSREPLYTIMSNKNGDKQEQFYIRDGNLSRRIESLKDIMEYCSKRFK